MDNQKSFASAQGYTLAGMFTLALRLVAGWTYFSAFWRRLILENKLDPDGACYIGEKFNHFLPNALLIKPGIEYLVSNEETLWWFMLVFTLVEGVVGLLFMLGLYTRMMSVGVFGLAAGILLGAGWLGTTCLDEWQIGVLGIAAGFTVFLSGGGPFSLDNLWKGNRLTARNAGRLAWLRSGELNLSGTALRRLSLAGALFITATTLFTNQYFHGGLWGPLHNLSVRPHVEISDAQLQKGALSFTVFRTEGADVYGSFLIRIAVQDAAGNEVTAIDGSSLAALSPQQIKNKYVAKVKPGKHSLILPLGAKATLRLAVPITQVIAGENYSLVLTDISGITWTTNLTILP